jgi:hypothetical protein
VGTDAGHPKPFKQCATAIGLQGPMRSTTASPKFAAWAEALFKRIGPYPAGFLTDTFKPGNAHAEMRVLGVRLYRPRHPQMA